MAIAEFYESLSDAKKVHVLQDGKTIAENFPSVTDWKNYKIIVNKCWNEPSHVVCNSDSIIIRKVPLGLDPVTLGLIIVSSVSIGFGIWGGVEGYKARKEAEKVKSELEKLKNSSKDEVINLPYLKGASNTIATGKTQPYMIGENLFTPYILNAGKNYRGFSTISGTDGIEQFYNVVLECGFNKQSFRKIFCDDIVIKNFGDNSTTSHEGIYSLDSSVFASEDSVLEIAQDGNPFATSEFNQKIIEKQYSDMLKKHDSENPNDYEDLFYTLESNSMGADVCILFNGLRQYSDSGSALPKTRTIVPSYSIDYAHLVAIGDSDPLNHATWTEFTFKQGDTFSNVFTRDTLQQIRFNAHVDFNYSDIFQNGSKIYDEPITIRISTDDEKSAGTEYSDCYVQWIHSYCYDVKKSTSSFVQDKIIGEREASLSTLLGLKIKSTTANEDKLKSIQIVSSGIAKRYLLNTKTGRESWEQVKKPTSNPASWCLEVLTSECHNPSKISESEIDLESFGAWYEYCERTGHKLTVNHVITSGMTKSTILEMISECGHGYLYRNIYGKISVAIDCEKENAIAVLNEQNLISFNYTKDIKRKPDGLKLTYIDKNSGYQENTVMIMYDGSDPEERSSDSIISSVNVQGKTNHDEVCHYGYYLMKKERLRPKVAKATIGNEGMFFTPLSKVLVQHPSLKIGKGNGEIQYLIYSNDRTKITGLELYDSVDLSLNQNYSMIVQAVGTYGTEDYCSPLEIAIKGNKGITKEVEFVTPISATGRIIPHANDVFSYGLGTENNVSEMLISGIESDGNGYTLTLVDYDSRIVDDSESIPDYIPDFSSPFKSVAEIPEKPIVSFDDLYSTKSDLEETIDSKIESATFDVSPTYNAEFNTSVIKKDNTGSYTPDFISGTGYENKGLEEQNLFSGKWIVYVNGSSTPFYTVSGSSFRLDIQTILDSGIENLDYIEIVLKSNDESVIIRREMIQILTGASAYSVKISTPSIILETVENKKVSEITVKTKAEVYYGLKELTYQASDGWEYGIIESPDGMNISVNYSTGEMSLKILEGSSLADMGSLKIPVFIHSQTSTKNVIGFESGNKIIVTGFNGVTIGFYEADENGYFNSYFTWQKLSQNTIKLASLTQTVNNYWNELTNDRVVTVPEKNTLERLMNTITADWGKYTSYYSSYNYYSAYNTKYEELLNVVEIVLNYSGNYPFDSEESKNAFNEKFEDYYKAKDDLDSEISQSETNFKGIGNTATLDGLTPKPNDFFVWTGDSTVYAGVQFQKGMTYYWTGSTWAEDNNSSHIMSTMNEALSCVTYQTSESIPAVTFAKRLITMQVITNELITKFATVGALNITNRNIVTLSDTVDEKANQSDLTSLSGTVTTISDDVSDLSDDLSNLSDVVDNKADGQTVTDLTQTVSNISEEVGNKADKTDLNKKRNVFNDTPTVPYLAGDLWIRTQNVTVKKPDETTETVSGRVIYYAKVSKTSSQTYNEADWEIGDNLQDSVLKEALTQGDTQIIGGYINTNLIEAESINAEKIDVDDLFAKNIEATDMHLSGNSSVEGKITSSKALFKDDFGCPVFEPYTTETDGFIVDINLETETTSAILTKLNKMFNKSHTYGRTFLDGEDLSLYIVNVEVTPNDNKHVYSLNNIMAHGFCKRKVWNRLSEGYELFYSLVFKVPDGYYYRNIFNITQNVVVLPTSAENFSTDLHFSGELRCMTVFSNINANTIYSSEGYEYSPMTPEVSVGFGGTWTEKLYCDLFRRLNITYPRVVLFEVIDNNNTFYGFMSGFISKIQQYDNKYRISFGYSNDVRIPLSKTLDDTKLEPITLIANIRLHTPYV